MLKMECKECDNDKIIDCKGAWLKSIDCVGI